VAAVLAFTIFMATRRHRAASGGCVGCRFQCQHAMTEETSGRWPTLTATGARHIHSEPARSVPVLLPMPAVRVAATSAAAGPRWPDRPLHHSGTRQRERAGSAA
jgi:hypothetical protein